MSPIGLNILLVGFTATAIGAGVCLWVSHSNFVRRVRRFNVEMLEASRDSSVGGSLTVPNEPETARANWARRVARVLTGH